MSSSINGSMNFGQNTLASSQGVNDPNTKFTSLTNHTSQIERTPNHDTFRHSSEHKGKKTIAAVVTAALAIIAGIAIFRGRNTFGNFGQKFINGFKFGKAHRLATKHVRFEPVKGKEGLYDITLFHKGKKTGLTKEGGYLQARFKDGKLTLSETEKFNSALRDEKLDKHLKRMHFAICRHPEFNGKPITEFEYIEPDGMVTSFDQKHIKLSAKALELKAKPTTEGEQSPRDKFLDDHENE